MIWRTSPCGSFGSFSDLVRVDSIHLFHFHFTPTPLPSIYPFNTHIPLPPPPPFFFFNLWRDHVLTARFQPPFIFYHTICHTQRYAHQEEYFALDDAEFRNVTSILKLLALGAHKVCRTLHVSSFAYDAPFFSPCFFSSFSPLAPRGQGVGVSQTCGPNTPPKLVSGHMHETCQVRYYQDAHHRGYGYGRTNRCRHIP